MEKVSSKHASTEEPVLHRGSELVAEIRHGLRVARSERERGVWDMEESGELEGKIEVLRKTSIPALSHLHGITVGEGGEISMDSVVEKASASSRLLSMLNDPFPDTGSVSEL